GRDIVLLVLVGVLLLICACAYAGLSTWSSRQRGRLGLKAGQIQLADDSRLGSPTLRSERLGVVARPDHVLNGNGGGIRVEYKPSWHRIWPSHRLQVAAQCVLLEETSGVRPTHGVLVLANGRQELVPFTPELDAELDQAVQRMRQILESPDAAEPCWT